MLMPFSFGSFSTELPPIVSQNQTTCVVRVRHVVTGMCCAQAYAFPKFHFDLHLCKSNRPPHTAVRGPGEIQATMLAEHLIEHVAARLQMDPMLVRERNFIKHDGKAFLVKSPSTCNRAVRRSRQT